MPTRNHKLGEDEKEDQARLEALRTAIHAGDESGIAEGDVFEQVRDYIRQLEAARKRDSYQQARKRATARLRKGSDLHIALPLSRDELHERQG